ncbi:efflux transporter outer membrane subunit [Xanthomonas citri]|nr:efflux transporter outer membrane subunit [Xanthomonas citri]
MSFTQSALATLVASMLAGCASLAPDYERPAAPVASQWPADSAPGNTVGAAPAAALSWQALFADPKLRGVVQLALDNNRNLRTAALNIERARALYRIQRADLLPELSAGVSGNSGRTPASLSSTGAAVTSHSYRADLNVAWELDLFGRVRSLSDQALQEYFATEAAQYATRLGLVSEVASTYLALAADREQLALANDTLRSRQDAYDLQRQLRDVGSASDLALRQAESELEGARDQALALQTSVATDRNALELLVGAPLPAELQPDRPLESMLAVQDLPAGLPSDLLQRRPDILAAEHRLIGANANIGAARAAFFPSIRLTGGIGRASDSLSNLFDGGGRAWSFLPQVSLPIFSGGRLRANLAVAGVDRDIAVADYERAIQSAFREVADALAIGGRLDGRLEAQKRRVDAAREAHALVQRRYDTGVSSYLEVLDAQRTLYAAQQNWIGTRLARQANVVTLYKALGGDFTQTNASLPPSGESVAARSQ